MTYIKLEDAVKAVERYCPAERWTQELNIAIAETARNEIADALRSLPTDDGVTDEMVERASKAVIETANWRNMRGIDEGSPLWGKKVARAALEAALGPLPAPPAC